MSCAWNRDSSCRVLAIAVAVGVFNLCSAASGVRHADAGDWRSFQNGGRPEVVKADCPTEWSPESGIVWERSLAGYGQSSPVIAQGQVYVTSLAGDLKETLFIEAFDLKSGKRNWKVDAKNSSPQENNGYVSKAAPTPVCDDTGVIALFEGGNILSLSAEGKVRWQRDLVAEYGPIKSRHGLAASLEQNDELVFVWIERQDEPYVLALSKQTGKTLWKAEGLGVTSWSSPRLVPVGDGQHLILSGIGKLAGLDPQTGKRLWEFDGIAGNSTPTPVPLGDGRFLIGATVGRGESGGGTAAASNGVLEISGSTADGYSVTYLWHAKEATSSFGSPIAHRGLAWFVNRSGVLFALDLQTGEEKLAKRTASSIWATPLASGDKVYLFGKNGVTTILNSGTDFAVIAENRLWNEESSSSSDPTGGGQPTLYAAAAADGLLILRRGDRLFMVGE